MRISTIQAFNTSVRGIQDNYSAAMRTQEQISSGKRLLSPTDDPVASVRLLQLDQEASKLSQYKDNLTAATNSLTQQEAVLNSVNNILQRVREIALSAGNGALDAGGRQALAQELAEREDELYGLLNSQNARGSICSAGSRVTPGPLNVRPMAAIAIRATRGSGRSRSAAPGWWLSTITARNCLLMCPMPPAWRWRRAPGRAISLRPAWWMRRPCTRVRDSG